MAEFEQCFNYTIQNEGKVYTNDIRDQGGATKFGITLATLSDFRRRPCHPQDVQNLTLDQAKEVYLQMFWDPLQGSDIVGQCTAMALFDIGVNMGLSRVIRLAQKTLSLPADGLLGEKTLSVLNNRTQRLFLSDFIPAVQNEYIALVLNDSSNLRFLSGWLKRSQRLIKLMI